MKWIFLFCIILSSTSQAFWLEDAALDLNFGYPANVSLTNPDDTVAHYSGFGFNGKFAIPINDVKPKTKIGNLGNVFSSIAIGATIEYKYLNLKNNFSGNVEETAKHQGYGLGAYFRLGSLYLSGSYGFMKARHEAIGTYTGLSSFKYNPLNTEIGFLFPHGNILDIGATYGITSATFSKTETGLSKDVEYKEQMIWLKVIFYFENR